MKNELKQIIADASYRLKYSYDEMLETINLANIGQLSGFINNDNLHLFRQYRNNVSKCPHQLLADSEVLITA